LTLPPDQSVDATFPEKDGHTIATGNVEVIVTTQTYSLDFVINKLKFVQRICYLEVTTSPLTNAGVPSKYFKSTNVVGITMMGVPAGITVVGATMTTLLTCIGV